MIISVNPIGNLGNRMIAYMAALALGRGLGGDVSYNCDLPEWGMPFDRGLHDRLQQDGASTTVILDNEAVSIEAIIDRVRGREQRAIVMDGFFQRIRLLEDPAFYRDVFPTQQRDDIAFADDELVINIRAGELREGWGWYPLVPPGFYRALIEATGYRPVFIGQLDDSAYLREIVAAFPDARMIPSAGAMIDFNRLRHARRICISTSTFSWLAAWLSEAAEIQYPLLGFLHPTCFRFGKHGLGGIDLAPANDPRYRFHLLPILRGGPEVVYLDFVRGIDPIAKEVPASFVRNLKTNDPILPRLGNDDACDEAWYLRNHLDAAWEIGEGWYFDASHHFTEIGRLRGYRGYEAISPPKSAEIARTKPATQSSLSDWSIGRTIAEDAGRAVDGDTRKDLAFHTGFENRPWWLVDLLDSYSIECIAIFNRRCPEHIRKRLTPFAIELSADGESWTAVVQTPIHLDIGCETGWNPPYRWTSDFRHVARFVRLTVLKDNECLHLAAVEIHGRKAMP